MVLFLGVPTGKTGVVGPKAGGAVGPTLYPKFPRSLPVPSRSGLGFGRSREAEMNDILKVILYVELGLGIAYPFLSHLN